MKKVKLKVNKLELLSDTVTPVSLYLNARDKFPNSLLLESSDYHGTKNNHSYLCFDQIASFSLQNNVVKTSYFDKTETGEITKGKEAIDALEQFIQSFEPEEKLAVNGVFGFTSFDSSKYFETLKPRHNKNDIPDMYYSCFRFVVQFDHFNNSLLIVENQAENEESRIDEVKSLINYKNNPGYKFDLMGDEACNISSEEYKKLVASAKSHCQRGDVFQLVLSRQYTQDYKGDEFNVYRALRVINPSPYLYYFDFGDFKIFGSSPEAQLKIADGQATINPIAGTFKRTGNDEEDYVLAQKLLEDPKENAEHTMLVDLARNDLSRHCRKVEVKTYKEVQFYSHVIHLVSEVQGELMKEESAVQVFADTFPAGTLSGAPKFKALELIDKHEASNRGFYGGAIGYFGFDNSVNHAITIRSFISKSNSLTFQAGAGIVADSDENNELQEVNNKIEALRKALIMAEKI